MWFKVLIACSVLVSALGQGAIQSQCPSPNGFFADAVQCDRYYHCQDDVITEKLCSDGMGFNDLNPRIEKCDFLFQVDCAERTELQPANPTAECPRQNGYYPVADETVCDQFYFCSNGLGNLIKCPEGLAFSLKTGNCVWPDVAERIGCKSKDVVNFTCPHVGVDLAVAHPRYADPHDCQFFYVCINGVNPRRNGCSFGMVFNTLTQTCDAPTKVPECSDYYTEYFENYFNTLGDDSGRISADIIAAAITSGFHVPNLNDRQRIHSPQSQRRGTTVRPAPVRGALDDGDSTVFRARAPNSRSPTSATSRPLSTRHRLAPITSETGLKRRNRPNHPRTRPAGGSVRRTTTTTTPPPPPPVDDYVLYDDADYYNDYPVDEAAPAPITTPTATNDIPTEAPRSGVRPFRRTLIGGDRATTS